jgi:hypothetical protein
VFVQPKAFSHVGLDGFAKRCSPNFYVVKIRKFRQFACNRCACRFWDVNKYETVGIAYDHVAFSFIFLNPNFSGDMLFAHDLDPVSVLRPYVINVFVHTAPNLVAAPVQVLHRT